MIQSQLSADKLTYVLLLILKLCHGQPYKRMIQECVVYSYAITGWRLSSIFAPFQRS